MGQSYPIYAWPCTNHARYSLVHVTFQSTIKGSTWENTWQVESAVQLGRYRLKIVAKSHYLKRRGRKVFI